ncbi:MAG: chorismate mutase [Bacteroidetes bacterium]|jgi:chorismate mutase|nr:chorismate mutase [Bacteroidota bacterium]
MSDVKALRERIDAIDRSVVALLNERVELAIEIGRQKLAAGSPLYDPAREDEIMRHVMSVAAGPLPPAAVRRVFERIIDETRSVERTATEPR